ncbi:MAG: LacI family DNA-binding transcriptional regulator [Sphingomonadales bacterium]|nr:LacI family DNA-binding transcriptional regulator [Sphingomonadales bacterium]
MTSDLRTKERRATIDDVARRAGVSIKTVSRVLNNEPNVRPVKRQQVLEAARALNYSPNISARSLAGDKSFLIALLYRDPSLDPSPNYISYVQIGALAKCRQYGFYLLLEPYDMHDPDVENEVQRLIIRSRVDGLILIPPISDSDAIMRAIEASGLPYVRIAPGDEPDRAPHVFMDDRQAAYDMTEHLLKLGHRRIGFIKAHLDHGAAQFRLEGFQTAMAEHNVPVDPPLVGQGDFTVESGMRCTEAFLDLPTPPTAVFAANDEMAAGAIAAAHKRGLAVPADLCVSGFDDSSVAAVTWPPLTTVHQPIAEMAEAATELLIERIKGHKSDETGDRFPSRQLDYRIVVRDSTATAPAEA